MTSANRQAHCPDCGRPVEAGADLCSCGFPLMFLRQEEPEAAVLKPSRRPAEDSDDTDELPVVEAPPPRLAPSAAPSAVAAAALDGLVCASCEEVNPSSRTWCAHCGAALRERRDPTEVLLASPAPRPRRRALLVAGAAAAVVVVAAGGAALALRGEDDPRDRTVEDVEVGPLAIRTVTPSATGSPSIDSAERPVTFGGDNLHDGDTTTAWRVENDGKDVELVLTLDGEKTVSRVGLVPGYAKTDETSKVDRFEENGRVTLVSWEFDDERPQEQVISRPTRDWAWLTLDEPVVTTTVTLVIEASQPGTRKDRTTAISEVQVVGR